MNEEEYVTCESFYDTGIDDDDACDGHDYHIDRTGEYDMVQSHQFYDC